MCYPGYSSFHPRKTLFNDVLWGDETDDKGLVGEVEEVREVQEGQEIKEGQEGLRETEKNLVGISSLAHLFANARIRAYLTRRELVLYLNT